MERLRHLNNISILELKAMHEYAETRFNYHLSQERHYDAEAVVIYPDIEKRQFWQQALEDIEEELIDRLK